MKSHKDYNFDVEHGPHMGESMMGIFYRDVNTPRAAVVTIAEPSITIKLIKLKWWQRMWQILNMDVKDVWRLITK